MPNTNVGLSTQKNILWNSAGSIIRLACNWLITVLVVRLSKGFDAGGVLSLAMAVANLVNPFAEFRLRTVQVTDVDGEHTSGEYIGSRMITTLSSFAIGIGYALLTCDRSAFPAIALYLLQALLATFIEASHAICQRHGRMDYIGISYATQGMTNLIAFSSLMVLTNRLDFAIAGMAATTLLVGVLYSFPRAAAFEPIVPSANLLPIARILLKLFPIVIAQVAGTAVLTVPKQFLSQQFGDAALGIYSAIASPTVIVQMGASFLYTPMLGIFAQRLKDDKASALVLLRNVFLGITGILVCASIGFYVAGEPLLVLLFGERIHGNLDLIQPALMCTFVTAIGWFLNDLLLSIRDYRASFLGNVVAAGVALVITRPFVLTMQKNGVSMVGIVAYLVGALVLLLFFIHDYRRLNS